MDANQSTQKRNFPQGFPWGSDIWIWNLPECDGGNVQKIIARLKANNIQTALIKCGDGVNTWEQWNQELVDAFHLAGLKIFSWSFVYGQEPLREAAIANWALDMGADGHVFDAESAYEHLPNPGVAASTMLQAVRSHLPNALLGHSPEPIIDYHQYFPYVEFGKYCDFVMPQVYFGEWGKTPTEGINWMFEQWSKWEAIWQKNGFSDSIKPIIPVHQTYDWTSTIASVPDYVVTPAGIAEFVYAARGYKAVSFYEYSHILRNDCWDAIKNNDVSLPTNADLGLADNVEQGQVVNGTQAAATPATSTPLQSTEEVKTSPQDALGQAIIPQVGKDTTTSPASTSPAQRIDLPESGHTTITVTKNPKAPSGVQIQVVHHTPHALVLKMFFTKIFHMVLSLKKGAKTKEVSNNNAQ